MSTFSIKTVVVEEVGAWEECRLTTDHASHDIQDCPFCQGAGGAWSDAYKSLWADEEYLVHADDKDKTLSLTREWGVCLKCNGAGHDYIDDDGNEVSIVWGCFFCDGNMCEPGTQGEWEVRG